MQANEVSPFTLTKQIMGDLRILAFRKQSKMLTKRSHSVLLVLTIKTELLNDESKN
jgi:hypothetical protein